MNHRMSRAALLLVMPACTAWADGLELPHGLTLSFEERLRAEWRENNFDFDDKVDARTDDSWLLNRTRVGISLQAKPWMRLVVQGQDLRESFSDRPDTIGALGAEGDDDFDLRIGYLEIGDPNRLSVSVGRQELNYGEGRLISRAVWKNTGQSFDAARVHYQSGNWWADAFVSSLVRFRDGHFNESDWLSDGGRNETLSGVYISGAWWEFQVTDLYLLELHADDRGSSDFVTLGVRVKADPKLLGGWSYDSEMAFQTGTRFGKDLRAFAGHWGVGYTWLEQHWHPAVGVDYNYASGDADAADGHINTFQNLFPTNHAFYGFMDEFAWQNLHNPALHFSADASPAVKVTLDQRFYWLADSGDAWYRGTLAAVRPITPGANGFVGSEMDVTLYWKAQQHIDVQAGYSHFFAANYVEDSGAGDDANFAYLMATFAY